jgi:hypothetical protein
MGSGLIARLLLTAVTVPQVQSAPAMPCPERAVRGLARACAQPVRLSYLGGA